MPSEGINSLIDTIKFGYLLNIKNDSSFFNLFFSTIIIFLISFLLSNENLLGDILNFNETLDNIIYYIYQKNYNTINFKGVRCFKTTEYNTRSDQLFSNRFQAIWYYTIKTINKNSSINEIVEFSESCNIYDEFGTSYRTRKNEKRKNQPRDIYIVNQSRKFLLAPDIFCKVKFENQKLETKNNRNPCSSTVETITIKVFSYTKTMQELTNYIDEITLNYVKEIQNVRVGKKYIYTYLGKPENVDEYDYDRFTSWEECEFTSTRNFDNLFFENKETLISKINFFKDNRDWYDKEGHPWTFGLGLHGQPGTGKTSIIKCIANLLDRHIIIIPINKIKTQREFSQVYFESTYNKDNEFGSITFDNKIIVFEDLDCMGVSDIVQKRNKEDDLIMKQPNISANNSVIKRLIKKINEHEGDNKYLDDSEILHTVDDGFTMIEPKVQDKITLSYLLNIIDGIRETPGRILIITSNHYEKLDNALIRPGRIDCTLKMNNASYDTINSMFKKYYSITLEEFKSSFDNNDIDIDLELLKNYNLSPAEIVNIRMHSFTPEIFITNLYNLLHGK